MSNSLIKFVDKALMPAAVMILGKFLGVLATVEIFNINWSFEEFSQNIFAVSPTLSANQAEIVVSYSDLFMYTFLAIFFSYNIFRAIFLHNTHLNPRVISKLANRNLMHLIQGSYEIYHAAFAWLLFTAIANGVIIFNAVAGNSYIWVAVITTVTTVVLTSVLLQDVYKEIDSVKKHPGRYNWE